MTSTLRRPDVPDTQARPPAPRPHVGFPRTRALLAERWIVVLVPLVAELVIGYYLASHLSILGDSLSRVQNASAAVLSRDPHPEAIGFIWGPFPTAFQVPLVALRAVWPFLVTHGYAACIVTAVFCAASVWLVHAWCLDLGLPAFVRLPLVLVFWLHPLTLLLGAGGMSEVVVLFFLLVAARALAQWWEGGGIGRLVVVSCALGAAYLTRYETAGAGFVVLGVVTFQAYRGAHGDRKARIRRAALVATMLGVPFLACVLFWAGYSWLIIGEPFAQFTSSYGNSAQVAAEAKSIAEVTGAVDGFPRAVFFLRQIFVVVPSLLIVIPLLFWFGVERVTRIWAVAAVMGVPLLMQLIGAMAGTTFEWIRFAYLAWPATILLAAVLATALLHRDYLHELWHPVAAAVVLGVMSLSFLTIIPTLQHGSLASDLDLTNIQMQFLPRPYAAEHPKPARTGQYDQKQSFEVAQELRKLNPTEGSILVDSASTFAVIVAADNQRWFRITQDRDWEQAVAAPGDFKVRWILVSSANQLDAITKKYPELRTDGGTKFTLERAWGQFRLFAVASSRRK